VEGLADVGLVDELQRLRRRHRGKRDRERPEQPGEAARQQPQRAGDRVLAGAHGVRAEDDRRPKQRDLDVGVLGGGLEQEPLDLGLLAGVEEPFRAAGRPVLSHPDRVVGVEAVGGDRGGTDEAPHARARGGVERVHRPLDVDRAQRRVRGVAVDRGRKMGDRLSSHEALGQRVAVADIATAVDELEPAVMRRVEGPPRDADDGGRTVGRRRAIADPWESSLSAMT